MTAIGMAAIVLFLIGAAMTCTGLFIWAWRMLP